MKTILITDSCCDLPMSYLEENNIVSLSLTYDFKGQERVDDNGKSISYHQFYEAVKNGELPKTSQINANTFYELFKPTIEAGDSIIYIGFSSALSGTVNSARIAKDNILEDYSNADISIIDSKSASMGLGLLVYYANEMLKKGKSKEEIVDWVENNKLHLNHWFTVEDLNHLKRGGRVSAAAAVVGTILDIKPVLHVDDEGRLIPVTKVKGRKKSLKALVEKLEEKIVNPEEQAIFISHGDCEQDAEYVKKLISEKYSIKTFMINYVGPVIGSHSGPGTVALFFIGSSR